ncbi:MAG: hypothetical protein D6743_11255, partial [Calditrichaeota bacterium]
MKLRGLLLHLLLLLVLFAGTAFGQVNPHKKLRFRCETCHVPTSFSDIRFNHNRTAFPLEGHHAEVSCTGCHDLADFSKVAKDCFSCHEDVHQGKLGTDCTRCHTPKGFQVFDAEDIHARTRFPLMGKHVFVDCQSCHRGLPQGNISLALTRCESCHQQQYLDATDPNHVASGFSTDCERCHQMNGWKPASMPDHDGLFFPIFSGKHKNTWDGCQNCHNDAMNKKQFTCITCHEHSQTRMNATHQGMTGYAYNSTDCYQCHPTGEKAEFREHDTQFFPIFSGTHNNKWDQCQTCHTDNTNRKVFSCVGCHEHSQSKMDPKHQGITGYSFNSLDCYQCHPTGEKAEFREHDTQFFPIFSGTHNNKWDQCQTCHTDNTNRKVFSCV